MLQFSLVFILSVVCLRFVSLEHRNHKFITSKYSEILVDLSHSYDKDTIHWMDAAPFRFTRQIVTENSNFSYASNDFETGEHAGTHLDAPYHFNKKGWKVGDIPVERFFVNGALIDAKQEAAANPDYGLEVNKLKEWEEKNGPITTPTVFLIDFGWAKKYSNRSDYFGSKTMQEVNLHFPGISHEAAQWLSEKENIVGVGVDTPSVDTGDNSLNPQTHVKLTAVNKYMLENVALDGASLPEKGFKLYITPMKLREGSGAPCRIIASVKKVNAFTLLPPTLSSVTQN